MRKIDIDKNLDKFFNNFKNKTFKNIGCTHLYRKIHILYEMMRERNPDVQYTSANS